MFLWLNSKWFLFNWQFTCSTWSVVSRLQKNWWVRVDGITVQGSQPRGDSKDIGSSSDRFQRPRVSSWVHRTWSSRHDVAAELSFETWIVLKITLNVHTLNRAYGMGHPKSTAVDTVNCITLYKEERSTKCKDRRELKGHRNTQTTIGLWTEMTVKTALFL